jgi:hypothetical protein
VISTAQAMYILNTWHSISKSNRERRKRRLLLSQQESFNQSLDELLKLMSTQSRTMSRTDDLDVSMHSLRRLPSIEGHSITAWHVPKLDKKSPVNMSEVKDRQPVVEEEEEVEVVGINEYQFVMFMLRHLQIISHQKHIDPWINKFHELDQTNKGFLTLDVS